MALFGTDTEYGIAVAGKSASDLLAESREVVKAYRGKSAGVWNYGVEDPRNDMRGFHVDKLSQDPEDAQFDDPDAPHLPAHVERADRVLTNGARFYNDHGHPEYATPECRSLLDLVAQDKAGERIVWEAAQARMAVLGEGNLRLYKNNTDFHNASYGTHENYLISRATPFESLLKGLLSFFATRIIYAGAGKIGIEPHGDPGVYQLSQRADFLTEEASVDTLYRRPLVNTRDEPHADPREWRRLHVICGDFNMSEYAMALKVGATHVVCRLLETGWLPPLVLQKPLAAMKEVSRDTSFRWLVDVDGVGSTPAVDLQRMYLAAAKERLAGSGSDTDWVLAEWQSTLDGLERDPLALVDRLDWVAKRDMLSQFAEAEGLLWSDETLRSIDLAYSDVDPETGIYHGLEQAGQMLRLVSDSDIAAAMTSAPVGTRAAIRGALIAKYPEQVGTVSWGRVVLRNGGASWLLNLEDRITAGDVDPVLDTLNTTRTLDAFLSQQCLKQDGKP